MNNYKIKAVTSTVYQLSSLRLFGMPVKSYPTGQHVAEMYFDTEEEAKGYLSNRAILYFDNEHDITKAITDIKTHGCLSLDAVTAEILEVEPDLE